MLFRSELDYGQTYRELIWNWFSTTKIPVVQAWSFNVTRVPGISIRLGSESEDEQKAAMYDLAAEDQDGELGTGVFTVMVDIGVHANKTGDHVLWLYYIVSYILFKHKRMMERFGLRLHTFNASDYNREAPDLGDNIWTRWIRFRVTTQNFWQGIPSDAFEGVNLDFADGLSPSSNVAVSLDVDPDDVDNTANSGLRAGRVGDTEGEEDINI